MLQDYSLLNNINFNNTFLISRPGEDFVVRNQLIFLINTLGFKIETIQSFASIPLNNQNKELTKIYNGLYNLEITSYFSSAIDINLKFEYNNNVQTFDGSKSSFDSKSIILDFDWNINEEISFNLNGGVYELDKNYYNIFNTSINYIPENSKFSYSLRMNNLLNENEFLSQDRNSFFTSVTAIPLIPFYTFGSVKYIF